MKIPDPLELETIIKKIKTYLIFQRKMNDGIAVFDVLADEVQGAQEALEAVTAKSYIADVCEVNYFNLTNDLKLGEALLSFYKELQKSTKEI